MAFNIEIDNLVEDLKGTVISDFNIDSTYWVDVTCIINPHSFYSKPRIYRKYTKIIEMPGNHISVNDLPTRKSVVYKSEFKKRTIRGEIQKVFEEDNVCLMFAIDYGFMELCQSDVIYEPYNNLNLPALALHCQLADCQPRNVDWDERSINAMKSFVKGERASMTIRGKIFDKYLVDLSNSQHGSISTILALIDYTVLGYTGNKINKISVPKAEKKYFSFKKLKIGETLCVRLLSGKSLEKFYVADMDDYQKYLQEKENLTYFSKQSDALPSLEFTEGTPVSVLNTLYNTYERGLIQQITAPQLKALVHFVDTGCVTETRVTHMVTMPERFLIRPATAIYCSAEKNQVLDYRFLKFLSPGRQFKITLIEEGDALKKPNIVRITPCES